MQAQNPHFHFCQLHLMEVSDAEKSIKSHAFFAVLLFPHKRNADYGQAESPEKQNQIKLSKVSDG